MTNFDKITDRTQLVQSMLVPYSKEELDLCLFESEWESVLNRLYDQNRMLIRIAWNFRRWLLGEIPAPKATFSDLLFPGNDQLGNYCAVLLEKLRDLMIKTHELPGSCLKLVAKVARSFVTLVKVLHDIRPSGYLRKVQYALERIFKYLVGDLRAPVNEFEYERIIRDLFAELDDSLKRNASELCTFESEQALQKQRRASVPPQAARRGAHRIDRTAAAMAEQVWRDAQDKPEVSRWCVKSRVTYFAAFDFYKKLLATCHIYTPEHFVRCLNSARNRRNYKLRFAKRD